MLRSKLVALLTAVALATGAGAVVAFADDAPSSAPSTACPAMAQPAAPVAADEQEAADDVVVAMDAVQTEAASQTADDDSGDLQGADDQSEEADDLCQTED